MRRERMFWGLFFIVGAMAVVVSKLGFLGEISLWTIFFTVFLAAALIKSIFYRSPWGILFSLAFLCILYAKPLGIAALTPWTVLGAALLGSIGCSMLFHPRKGYWHSHREMNYGAETVEGETVKGDTINLSTSFAGSVKYITSDDFKKANLNCSFGSMKVYFDNAIIQGGRAAVVFDASFCGIELFVPKQWTVDNLVSSSFGGIEEKNRNTSTGTPVLQLTGHISFGGVTIVYV